MTRKTRDPLADALIGWVWTILGVALLALVLLAVATFLVALGLDAAIGRL